MSIFNRFKKISAFLVGLIGLRDVFVFGGLAMLGYGLYQVKPWIAFAICGCLLMILGLFEGVGIRQHGNSE